MEDYYSCHYIQTGINFYPNDTIKICCFSNASDVDICSTSENIDVIIQKIINKKKQMIDDFIAGNICDSCKNCPSLVKSSWGTNVRQVSSITFNHFMSCNLRCTHCGYRKEMETNKLLDTNHNDVLNIVKGLIKNKLTPKLLSFDVGGGEPSLSKGLIEIVQYCIENKYKVHINSNGAQYVQAFADGVNEGLVGLTLTPDAGSKEVYQKIKGADYFDETWKNIEKYMLSCKKELRVKFILEEGNLEDIDNMINMCIEKKVKDVILNLDLNIKLEDYPRYMPYVTKFRILGENNSINVHKGNFVPPYLWPV